MKRATALAGIAAAAGDELIVCNIGFAARELYDVGDRDANFYMTGSMGLASSIGLGIALCTSRVVWVVDGDGSVLMNLGTLATIANHGPGNYVLIILDDGSYSSTGGQPTATRGVVDLERMASAAGILNCRRVRPEELKAVLESLRGQPGPHVIVAAIESGNAPVAPVPLSPIEIKARFMSRSAG